MAWHGTCTLNPLGVGPYGPLWAFGEQRASEDSGEWRRKSTNEADNSKIKI